MKNYDIVIVGSGVACTSFLLQFLEKLVNNSSPKPFSIAVIEKYQEFWKGIPYGERSSPNSLTITSLGDFIPPSEKESFYKWLDETLDEWTGFLKEQGGDTGRQWLKNNLEAMRKGEWDELYVPRYLFGNFINKRLHKAIDEAAKKRIATVATLSGEAIDLTRSGKSYEITVDENLKETTTVSAGKVVLAIGSPPIKAFIKPQQEENEAPAFAYIADTYSPKLELNLKCISDVLSEIPNQSDRNILMLGSNASSLELLYLLATDPHLQNLIHKIVVVSYSGRLPYRISPQSDIDHKFENTMNLRSLEKFGPDELMTRIEKDIRLADENGVNIGNVYSTLNSLLVSLLGEMEEGQQKFFYDHYGQRFSKLIRRAGAEYRDAAEELEKKGKLELIAGSFQGLEQGGIKGKGVQMTYSLQDPGTQCVHPLRFPMIINCGGSEELDNSSSSLINSLITQKLCTANNTNRGFEVNEKFEAEKDLYVMGPLLGGIFNAKAKLWHVENAKSIFYLSGLLAEVIINSILIQV